MEQSLQTINNFLDGLFIYGPFLIYLALFLASFIENIFPPFPGDVFTLAGGALAAGGRLNIFLVFLSVYVGGILSVFLIYKFGYSMGRGFFLRKNYRYFSRDDIARLEIWFKKRGRLLLILNRFIVGARSAIVLVTGISRYDLFQTLIFISLSFWIFNGILLFGSYVFFISFEAIAAYFQMYEKIVWPIIILLALGIVFHHLRKINRNVKKS